MAAVPSIKKTKTKKKKRTPPYERTQLFAVAITWEVYLPGWRSFGSPAFGKQLARFLHQRSGDLAVE